MREIPYLQEIGVIMFGLAAGICALLTIYSFAKTDRNLPFVEARKKSIKKGYLFLALTFTSMMIMAGFIQPSNLETVAFCLIGGLLVFLASYGFAYFQTKLFGKNESARKIFYPEKNNNEKNE